MFCHTGEKVVNLVLFHTEPYPGRCHKSVLDLWQGPKSQKTNCIVSTSIRRLYDKSNVV